MLIRKILTHIYQGPPCTSSKNSKTVPGVCLKSKCYALDNQDKLVITTKGQNYADKNPDSACNLSAQFPENQNLDKTKWKRKSSSAAYQPDSIIKKKGQNPLLKPFCRNDFAVTATYLGNDHFRTKDIFKINRKVGNFLTNFPVHSCEDANTTKLCQKLVKNGIYLIFGNFDRDRPVVKFINRWKPVYYEGFSRKFERIILEADCEKCS